MVTDVVTDVVTGVSCAPTAVRNSSTSERKHSIAACAFRWMSKCSSEAVTPAHIRKGGLVIYEKVQGRFREGSGKVQGRFRKVGS